MKILFVVDDLGKHGVTTSLLNLFKLLKDGPYDMDLLVLNKADEACLEEVSKLACVINNDSGIDAYFQTFKKSLFMLLKQREFRLLLLRLLVFAKSKWSGPVQGLQKTWDAIIKGREPIEGEYDIAIGFQDYFSGVYALEKVKAKRYIGWNHNIYKEMGYDNALMGKYYERLDRVCTISEETKKSLIGELGARFEQKILIVPNAVDVEKMRALSMETLEDEFFQEKEKIRILSIGRLVEQKGFDFALDVAKILKDRGAPFVWYILGTGPDEELLKKKMEQDQLFACVKLYGYAENPYPFLKHCDIYAQPSRYEGFGIAISEAAYFRKPLMITPDVKERFREEALVRVLPFGNSEHWAGQIEEVIGLIRDGKSKLSQVSCQDEHTTKAFEQAVRFQNEEI